MTRKRLYFDTNVYDALQKSGGGEALKQLLLETKVDLCVSVNNLFESYRISHSDVRTERIRLITTAPSCVLDPEGYLHSVELVGEVRRLRAEWLDQRPDTSGIQTWLNKWRKRIWVEARLHPEAVPDGFDSYRSYADPGISSVRESQSVERRLRVDARKPGGAFWYDFLGQRIEADDVGKLWRAQCMSIWSAALSTSNPLFKDYHDYAAPYLRVPSAFADSTSWTSFWMDEVDTERMIHNALTSAVEIVQTQRKVSRGNAYDSLHATYLADTDLFLTADRGLFDALIDVGRHIHTRGKPALIEPHHRRKTDVQVAVAIQEIT